MSDAQLDYPLPSRSIPCSRAYSNVAFDPSTSLIVAASDLKARFTSFDEEGNKIWEPDGKTLLFSFFVGDGSTELTKRGESSTKCLGPGDGLLDTGVDIA
jgi:hypothetical protein